MWEGGYDDDGNWEDACAVQALAALNTEHERTKAAPKKATGKASKASKAGTAGTAGTATAATTTAAATTAGTATAATTAGTKPPPKGRLGGKAATAGMAVHRPRSPARPFSLRQTFPPLAAPHTAHTVRFSSKAHPGGVAGVGLALHLADPTLRLATLVASNSGRPGGACRALNGDVAHAKLHASYRTQEEDVVSNWLLTLSPSPTEQSTEFARISTAFGLRNASGTDFATIQGVDYTLATPRMYADAWCVTGAHLSVKSSAAFDVAQRYPTSLVFCAGPNAHAPPLRGPRASSMRRTFSPAACADMDFLAEGAAWAVYAALHASAACGCDAVLIPFVSGGLYAGPHDPAVLQRSFLQNTRLMLDGGFNSAPALGVHFREVIVVFLR